jgi:hypothetical protein
MGACHLRYGRGALSARFRTHAANVSRLVRSCSGDESRNICDTLRRRCPISKGLATLRTHEQHRGTKCNVGSGAALLANNLAVRS